MTGTTIPVSTGTLTVKEKKKDFYIVAYKSNVNSIYDNSRIEMTEKEVKRLMKMYL